MPEVLICGAFWGAIRRALRETVLKWVNKALNWAPRADLLCYYKDWGGWLLFYLYHRKEARVALLECYPSWENTFPGLQRNEKSFTKNDSWNTFHLMGFNYYTLKRPPWHVQMRNVRTILFLRKHRDTTNSEFSTKHVWSLFIWNV